MKYKTRLLKLISVSILLVFLVMFWDTSISYAKKATDSSVKTIRVGYYENEDMMEGASPKAIKKGYSYEYIQKIASLAGWRYEYVYGSREDCLKMLKNGQIDILPSVVYTEERKSQMLFPNEPMATESFLIYKLSNNKKITMDIKSLKNKRIGAYSGAMVDVLKAWLADNNVKADVIEFSTISRRNKALQNGEVDCMLGEGKSIITSGNIDPMMKVSENQMYFCVTNSRKDILSELNAALYELENENEYYITELSRKYFKGSSTSRVLTDKEREWVSNHKSIVVGYYDNYLPFCGTDSKGKPTGLLVDALPHIFENLDIKNMKITYKKFTDSKDMVKAVRKNEIDIAFPVSSNIYFLEQNEMYQSKALIETTTELIYKKKITEKTTQLVAVNKNNYIQQNNILVHYPDAKFLYCNTTEECLNAVLNGRAYSTTLNAYRSNGYLADSKYSSLLGMKLPVSSSRCFGVKYNNVALLSILNRGIATFSDDYVLNTLSKYEGKYIDYTIYDFFRDHFFETCVFVIVLVTILTGFVSVIIMKSRAEKVYDVMAHRDSMTGLLNRRAYEERFNELRRTLDHDELVYVSMDLNGLKFINDKFGHDAGDELIIGAADCMKSVFHFYGLVYRTGGDEFIAIINANSKECAQIKRDLAAKIAEWKGEMVHSMYLSFGLVEFSEFPDADIVEIAKEADKRMYDMKNEFYQEMRNHGFDVKRRIVEKIAE